MSGKSTAVLPCACDCRAMRIQAEMPNRMFGRFLAITFVLAVEIGFSRHHRRLPLTAQRISAVLTL